MLRIQRFFGDMVSWNGNFSLLTAWLPGGKKTTSFEYLKSSKNVFYGVKYVTLAQIKN